VLLTTEGAVLLLIDLQQMVLFEWLRDSRHPEFREVHKLLR
jgi:hypothetical protein